jgi:hypothetical protein
MLQICDMGQTALLPLRRKACRGFFRPKNPTASAEFEPAILGTRGQHANLLTTEVAAVNKCVSNKQTAHTPTGKMQWNKCRDVS